MKNGLATYLPRGGVLCTLGAVYVLSFIVGADPLPAAPVVAVLSFAVVGTWQTLRSPLPVTRVPADGVMAAVMATCACLFLARE